MFSERHSDDVDLEQEAEEAILDSAWIAICRGIASASSAQLAGWHLEAVDIARRFAAQPFANATR